MSKNQSFICICCLFLFLTSYIKPHDQDFYLHEITTSFARQMKEEYQLSFFGSEVSGPEKIDLIGISFMANRRASIEEARALEAQVTKKFVQAINMQKEIYSFLNKVPFEATDTAVSISFMNSLGVYYADGSVANVSRRGDSVWYAGQDGFSDVFFDLYEEPYDIAIKLVEATPDISLTNHQTTDLEIALDEAFEAFHQALCRKYNCKCWSLGCRKGEYLEEIGTIFNVFHRVTQEKAREIQVDATETLLEIVNNNDKLKPYLREAPFASDQVKMRLNFRYNKPWVGPTQYTDGSLESVTLENNELIYMRRSLYKKGDPFEKALEPDVLVGAETYEDAVRTVQETPKQTAFWKNLFSKM